MGSPPSHRSRVGAEMSALARTEPVAGGAVLSHLLLLLGTVDAQRLCPAPPAAVDLGPRQAKVWRPEPPGFDPTGSAAASDIGYRSLSTIVDYARRGVIPGHKLGRRWVFLHDELDAALRSAPRSLVSSPAPQPPGSQAPTRAKRTSSGTRGRYPTVALASRGFSSVKRTWRFAGTFGSGASRTRTGDLLGAIHRLSWRISH
jgi:hypothetical protein